jgi:hypothetical protein
MAAIGCATFRPANTASVSPASPSFQNVHRRQQIAIRQRYTPDPSLIRGGERQLFHAAVTPYGQVVLLARQRENALARFAKRVRNAS